MIAYYSKLQIRIKQPLFEKNKCMDVKADFHTALNSVCHPGINGPNRIEGLFLERFWGTIKASLNPLLLLLEERCSVRWAKPKRLTSSPPLIFHQYFCTGIVQTMSQDQYLSYFKI